MVACVHSAFLAGTLVGALSGGILADRYGRLPVLASFSVAALLFRIVLAFSPSVHFFIVFRFLIGLTNLDTFTSAFVLGTELVGPSWRVCFGTAMNQVWAVGYMLVPALAYALRDTSWRTLTLVLTGCSSFVLLYLCIVPESPRWQLSKGRTAPAFKTLKRMAKLNGRHLPDDLILETIKDRPGQAHLTPLTLLRTSAVRWRSAIVTYIWFSASLVYYGLSLNVGDLVGSLYLNTFVMGAVEVPAYFLAQILLGRLGRRSTLCNLLALCGALLLTAGLVPKHLSHLITVLAMLGKLLISAAFMGAYVITVELYPTGLRQMTLAVSSTIGRFGGTVAPFIGHLAVYNPILPVTIFGLCSGVAAILTLLLPETRGRPLPLTVEDIEDGSDITCCQGSSSSSSEDSYTTPTPTSPADLSALAVTNTRPLN